MLCREGPVAQGWDRSLECRPAKPDPDADGGGLFGAFHFCLFVFSSIYKNVEGKRVRSQKGSLLPEQGGHCDGLKSVKCFED